MSSPLTFGRPAPKTPAIFPRVAIVGVGLLGGSLGLAIRRAWPDSLVIGVDRKHVLEAAMLAHAVDVGADDLGMVGDADLVVLAAPVLENERLLLRLPGYLRPDAVITDVGSVKRGISAAAGALPRTTPFVGGHPIAGAASGGIAHATAELFTGHTWVLCPPAGGDLHRLDDFVRGLGAVPLVMSPERHDALIAFASHLPQLTASALMHVVGSEAGEEGLALAGRGLQDTARLAASPPEIWTEICAANADEIGRALDALITVLQELRKDLSRGELLEQVFRSARDWYSRVRP